MQTSISPRSRCLSRVRSFGRAGVFLTCLLVVALSNAQTFQVRPEFPTTDDRVTAIAVDAATGIIYIGGDFTMVGDQPRDHLAAIDLDSGAVLPWNPGCDGVVTSLTVRDKLLFVGGFYTEIGGQPRANLAVVSKATGIVTGWNPAPDSYILSVTIDSTNLYVTGNFTQISGQARNYLARYALSDLTLDPWDPSPSGVAFPVLSTSDKIYVGGAFTEIGGQSRSRIARFDKASGLLDGWDPDITGDGVLSLAIHGDSLYAGGSFTAVGGVDRLNLAAINQNSGLATPWNPGTGPMGDVWELVPAGTHLMAAGKFDAVGGVPRGHAADLHPVSGAVQAWNPGFNGNVHALVLHGNTLFAGGSFTMVNGQTRPRFAVVTNPGLNPVVQITGKSRVVTRESNLRLRGMAEASYGGLQSVQLRAGKKGFRNAQGTASWRFKTRLKMGRNRVYAIATATNGLQSNETMVTVVRKR